MESNKNAFIFGITGVLIGGLLTTLVASFAVNNSMNGMMRMMGMNVNPTNGEMLTENMEDHGSMSMSGMSASLASKTGDDFDKLFIEQMIDHHEGAVAMAQLAKKNAKHDEIKQMADGIIDAQTAEIQQMKDWQTSWSY